MFSFSVLKNIFNLKKSISSCFCLLSNMFQSDFTLSLIAHNLLHLASLRFFFKIMTLSFERWLLSGIVLMLDECEKVWSHAWGNISPLYKLILLLPLSSLLSQLSPSVSFLYFSSPHSLSFLSFSAYPSFPLPFHFPISPTPSFPFVTYLHIGLFVSSIPRYIFLNDDYY